MPFPKLLLEKMLQVLPAERLQEMARRNFGIFDGPHNHEVYAKRLATPSRTKTIIGELGIFELKDMAKVLEMDSQGLTRNALSARLIETIENHDLIRNNGATSLMTWECLKNDPSPDKVRDQLRIREDLYGLQCFTDGEKLLHYITLLHMKLNAFRANRAGVFVERYAEWPEPLLTSLQTIGATNTAQLLKDNHRRLFPGQSELSGKELFKEAMKIAIGEDENTAAKVWIKDRQETKEDVFEMAKSYLLAHPYLF